MAEPIQIAFVVPGVCAYFWPGCPWPTGGSERQAYLLGPALLAAGAAAVHYLVPDFGGTAPDVPQPGVRLWRSFRPGDGPLARARAVRRTLAAMPARVCVFRSASAGVAAGIWLAQRLGRRVVYMLAHDVEADTPALARAVGWPGALAMGRMYARVNAITAQTADQARDFSARRGCAVAAVVPNVCLPAPAAEAPVRTSLLWVGRAHAWKRGDAFLELARRLPEQPCVMVCGPGRRACETAWRRAAAALPNVTWHAALPHAALDGVYRAARLLVNTSSGEGVPNVMLEAMGNGCPVLSAVVDPDGALTAGGGGLCVGALDNAALVAACRELLADPARLTTMGLRARAWIAATHAPERAAAPLMAVLQGLMTDPDPQP